MADLAHRREPATRRVGAAGLLGAGLAASCFAAMPANAQSLADEGQRRDETIAYRERLKDGDNIKKYGAERVVDRDRKMYLPDGIRSGNYLIFPSLGATVVYDDNIYATNKAKEADVITKIEPTVRFQSHLPRHILDFGFGARATRYGEHDEFDTLGGFGSIDGALHFDHAHTLSASILTELDHEDRLSPDAPTNAKEKTPIFHNRASVGIRRDAGRLWGSFGATAESWNYHDVKARDGSIIRQDNRDTEIYSGTFKAGYRFSPATTLETKFRGLRQLNDGVGGISRDAMGYEALAGLSSEINPLLRWRVLGGYGLRDYDDASLGNVARSIAEAEIQWLTTQTLTLYATLRRAIDDEESGIRDGRNSISALGRVDTSIRARAEYEAWRNLLFTFEGEYRDSDFIGVGRQDKTAIGRIGIDYYHTKNWLFSLGFEHLERQSTNSDYDVTRNKVWLGMKLRF